MIGDLELREPSPELARRYRDEGLWSDDTLGGLLDGWLGDNPGVLRVWSSQRPRRTRLAEIHELSRRLAAGLRSRGIAAGDPVAVQLPNWPEAAIAYWGASLLGAVPVPVVHFYGPKELGFILRQSAARALILPDRFATTDYLSYLERLRPSLAGLEVLALVALDESHPPALPSGASRFTDLLESAPLRAPEAADPASPAMVAYTSGTTADPKGVVHSHRSIAAELRHLGSISSPDTRPSLMGAPVGHAIGMLGGLLGPLARGRSVHLADAWNPEAVLAAMRQGDLVFSGGATYFLTSLLDAAAGDSEALDRMRFAGLGGSPVPAEVAERARRLGVSVVRAYGSTEHPSLTGGTHGDPEAKRLFTDGRPLAGVELRLVGEDGTDVSTGQPGQILSRGPDLFAGYTDPELTGAALDADGWYSTGDIGILDDDGYLRITDRVQDLIIRGGENVSAAEVEGVLLGLEGVTEAAVVAAPDARMGERACAFVRMRPGSSPVGLDEVRAHFAASGTAKQKWPEEVRLVDELPRTPSGKVKKYALRDQLRQE